MTATDLHTILHDSKTIPEMLERLRQTGWLEKLTEEQAKTLWKHHWSKMRKDEER